VPDGKGDDVRIGWRKCESVKTPPKQTTTAVAKPPSQHDPGELVTERWLR
jgi:hypothetical protein